MLSLSRFSYGSEVSAGTAAGLADERGEFLPAKLPLDSALARAIRGDQRECREAVRVQGVMQHSARVEAGIYLIGLLASAPDDWEWHFDRSGAPLVRYRGCARLLFSELRAVKGSNTTRRFRDAVLKTLATLSAGLTRAGFAAMLEDATRSQRTCDKVACILNGVDDRQTPDATPRFRPSVPYPRYTTD